MSQRIMGGRRSPRPAPAATAAQECSPIGPRIGPGLAASTAPPPAPSSSAQGDGVTRARSCLQAALLRLARLPHPPASLLGSPLRRLTIPPFSLLSSSCASSASSPGPRSPIAVARVPAPDALLPASVRLLVAASRCRPVGLLAWPPSSARIAHLDESSSTPVAPASAWPWTSAPRLLSEAPSPSDGPAVLFPFSANRDSFPSSRPCTGPHPRPPCSSSSSAANTPPARSSPATRASSASATTAATCRATSSSRDPGSPSASLCVTLATILPSPFPPISWLSMTDARIHPLARHPLHHLRIQRRLLPYLQFPAASREAPRCHGHGQRRLWTAPSPSSPGLGPAGQSQPTSPAALRLTSPSSLLSLSSLARPLLPFLYFCGPHPSEGAGWPIPPCRRCSIHAFGMLPLSGPLGLMRQYPPSLVLPCPAPHRLCICLFCAPSGPSLPLFFLFFFIFPLLVKLSVVVIRGMGHGGG